MKELILCSKERFKQKINELSIEEMQKLLWELEERSKQLKKYIHLKNNIQKNNEIENSIVIQAINGKGDIDQRIRICREAMLTAKYLTVSNATRNINNSNIKKFSWGIKESEPQILFSENVKKNPNETITVTCYGEFRWRDQKNLSVDQMPDQRKGINFKVPTLESEDGKTIIHSKDILEKVNQIQAQSGNLKLFKVEINGNQNLEYFMLFSIEDLQSISKEQLIEHFGETYLSEAHKKMVINSLKTEKCLYGGTIVKGQNGKLETRFYDVYNQAVAKANASIGTCMTTSGKMKFGTIQDLIDGISGRLSRTKAIQSLNRNLNEFER